MILSQIREEAFDLLPGCLCLVFFPTVRPKAAGKEYESQVILGHNSEPEMMPPAVGATNLPAAKDVLPVSWETPALEPVNCVAAYPPPHGAYTAPGKKRHEGFWERKMFFSWQSPFMENAITPHCSAENLRFTTNVIRDCPAPFLTE